MSKSQAKVKGEKIKENVNLDSRKKSNNVLDADTMEAALK